MILLMNEEMKVSKVELSQLTQLKGETNRFSVRPFLRVLFLVSSYYLKIKCMRKNSHLKPPCGAPPACTAGRVNSHSREGKAALGQHSKASTSRMEGVSIQIPEPPQASSNLILMYTKV